MRYWGTPEPKRAPKKKTAKAPRRSIASGGTLRQYPFLRTFYQHQADISEGLQKFLFYMVLATLLYVFVLGDAGAFRIMSLKKEKSRLEADVAAVTFDIELLQTEIDRLKTDPAIIEKLGRELYGYVAPGDKVYKIIRSHNKD
jgi:cell division protein FtsB